MKRWWISVVLSASVTLASCGGGGGSGGASPPPPTAALPPPSATPAGCSLADRQSWVRSEIQQFHLFPNLLANPDPGAFNNLNAYVDAIVAPARAQNRDRFFTFVTSIAEDNAFFSSGQSAGFGFRLSTDTAARRVIVSEAFEGAPALAAGIDRGTEILAIGTSAANLVTVDSIIATGGAAAVTNALGPNTAGTTRVLRVRGTDGVVREVSVAKADFQIPPVSSRYGARIIEDGGRRVGYVNLRTFIDTAEPQLRSAFANFRAQGITQVIVDLRYNGGGLVKTGELLADLLGGSRTTADVQGRTIFRPELASNNSTRFFAPQPESIPAMRIAFIGTGATASASELVINAFIPYLGNQMALIGANTFGKPVGQIARDRASCDDRLRVVAFQTVNSANQGEYYSGLAGVVPQSCQAGDDLTRQLGDPAEASIRAALNFIAGGTCTPITASASLQSVGQSQSQSNLLQPAQPSVAQREVPGLF